jgi:hypothetical protein
MTAMYVVQQTIVFIKLKAQTAMFLHYKTKMSNRGVPFSHKPTLMLKDERVNILTLLYPPSFFLILPYPNNLDVFPTNI